MIATIAPPNMTPAEAENMVLEIMQAARIEASRRMPYFSSGMYAMSMYINRSVPLAGVDTAARMYVHPENMIKVIKDFPQFGEIIWLHEYGHVFREEHKWRARLGIPVDDIPRLRIWNMAADLWINGTLEDMTPVYVDAIQKTGLSPKQFDFEYGLSSIEYYDLLMEKYKDDVKMLEDMVQAIKDRLGNPQPGDGSEDGGSPGSGQGDDPLKLPYGGNCSDGNGSEQQKPAADKQEPGLTDMRQDVLRGMVQKAINDDASKIKSRGLGGGSLVREAAQVNSPPPVDYRRELRSFLRGTEVFGEEYHNFSRPSRRSSEGGVISPNYYSYVPKVGVVVDTSGSMSDEDLGSAVRNIRHIIRSMGGVESVSYVSCDGEASDVQEARNPNQIKLTGGGGTDMEAGMNALAKGSHRIPDLVLVLTDGETPWPEVTPNRNIIFCAVILGNCKDGQGVDYLKMLGSHVPKYFRKVIIDPYAL